jgi:hypothetical protein
MRSTGFVLLLLPSAVVAAQRPRAQLEPSLPTARGLWLIRSRLSFSQDSRTPLHWAASNTSLELMEVLLKNVPAPDLELGDASGSTPLIIAGASRMPPQLSRGSSLANSVFTYASDGLLFSELGHRGQRRRVARCRREPVDGQLKGPDSAVNPCLASTHVLPHED